ASPEELELIWMRDERRAMAEEMRAESAAAMVPLALIAGFFAFESEADVFLEIFPAGKATELIQLIRAARKRRKAARQLEQELVRCLDEDQARFVHAAARLGASDMKAARVIHEHVQSARLVSVLMHRATHSHGA